MMLIEAEDYWLVTMEGEPINQLVIDYQVRLRAYDHPVDIEIVLTTPFRLVINGEKHVVRPGDMETIPPLLTIYRKQADGSWLLARDAHTLAPVAG